MGAWIETLYPMVVSRYKVSHPVWVRGLKLEIRRLYNLVKVSHPVWVRGLKQRMGMCD